MSPGYPCGYSSLNPGFELWPWATRSLAQKACLHRLCINCSGETVLLGLARELGTEKGWVQGVGGFMEVDQSGDGPQWTCPREIGLQSCEIPQQPPAGLGSHRSRPLPKPGAQEVSYKDMGEGRGTGQRLPAQG